MKYEKHSKLLSWVKFVFGLALMAGIFSWLGYGSAPPGVVSHNLEAGIDATPIWYMEVENMAELEAGVEGVMEANTKEGKSK
ncbi:MAG: hypothetical protein HQ591_08990 [candidate division Zixibacteria bacterium]|nr:hypothetical protein [Candidatus Tariuqbacter arcticus]